MPKVAADLSASKNIASHHLRLLYQWFY
ncbi:MAG: hypothetical protein ACI8QG_001554, partial [Flavobacteriales bacterium]